MVVDDDPGLLRSLGRLLPRLGYTVALFPTADAFEKHRDFENAVCILLDIDLGNRSGIELGQHLKALDIAVPIIYMTGNSDPAVRAAALRSGCLACLSKPFGAQSLIDLLQQARAGPG
ncbi:MAG: hypothetical protein QOJ86_4996 [Bradyrhizobium sp.]|jgi:FixJ family two-component response regulator|nr:hypothetical protein [Bradyrhizobium sp.]